MFIKTYYMKKLFVLLCAGTFVVTSCSYEKGRFLDLRTGKTIEVEKDPQTGAWLDADTKEPVYIYVDTEKKDTIYGRTGAVINGHVVRGDDNVYWYDVDFDKEYKVKDGDYKMEVEKDGDVKIKTENKKIKKDGETGEVKVKYDD